jgi:HNH endonuclease
MTTNDSLSRLSDDELLNEVKRLAAIEREATADLIRSLAEVEARRLHLASGCSSMFAYCTQVLHLSEHAAYARIAAARAATRFPIVMNLLIEGAITLTTVTLLGRHLTDANHAALLESARHKSKADVEMLVATLHPQPDIPSSVRKVPVPKLPATAPLILDVTKTTVPPATTTGEFQNAPPPPPARPEPVEAAVVRAIAPERYKLQVTIGADTRAKLRRAQDLLRHTNRSADEAAVIDRALTVLVEQLERVKYGRTDRPRPAAGARGVFERASRYVPAHVRRAVSGRDGHRCAFVGPEGRCTETAGLHYHHRIPFADGGPTTVDNLELRCPAHNAYEAERWFGPLFVRETSPAWLAQRSAQREASVYPPERPARRWELGLDQVVCGREREAFRPDAFSARGTGVPSSP